MENVASWLEVSSLTYQDKTALVTNSGSFSFTKLESMSSSLAHYLRNNGVMKGERLLICSNEHHYVVAAIFATLKIGAVFVVIHPETPKEMLEYYISHSGATVILTDHALDLEETLINQVKLKIQTSHPKKKQWENIIEVLREKKDNFKAVKVSSSDIAALIYTSGSSGNPKGVISSHGNINFSTNVINNYLNHTFEDNVLCFLPLSFDYGLYQIFLCISKGATLIVRNSTYFAFEAPGIIEKYGVTGIVGVRNILTTFCKIKNIKGTNKIRYITNTGEYLDYFTITELRKLVPKADVFLMYGLTECKRVSYLPPKLIDINYKSVGYPLNGTQVSIVNEYGEECQPFVKGELLVKGPHVTIGYWNDKTETDKRFVYLNGNRYLKTGDIFYKDNEGLLYFVSRKDFMFKSKGYRIEPEEIESQIKKYVPTIDDIIVVDYLDTSDNTIKIGYFVSVNTCEYEKAKKQLQLMIKKKIEPWKRPSKLIITKSPPLTNSGKIDRKTIRAKFEIDDEKKEDL
ncbi:class I adenylate-forming enzyme family protein [Bacillus sp. 166amftsu]|uniref:class I adenylate-forming enzyme family protein n=1 Tax=Bacillus sp. 166amftsu TaxID=1761753 RepID=UPI0008983408|nr:class I adenylate-forming enzyme family protein [Bacillus sp. 166amftsu]SDZ37860.1 Acyl-CoA synthetase (AMP-forming)/AMP-acid ligase II [Bacillus sp. 166amftsu]